MNEVMIAREPKTAQMEELVMILDDQCVTTSLKVAEYFKRDHRNVLRSIRTLVEGMLKSEHTPEMFREINYFNEQNGQSYDYFEMNRDGFSLLVMGFNNCDKALEFKLLFIEAFNRMEKALKAQSVQAIPQTFAQALRLAAEQQEQIEAQQKELEQKRQLLISQQSEIAGLNEAVSEMRGKVSYLDRILACTDTVLTTIIGQDYGMTAIKFNKLLQSLGIQHRVGKVWVINSRYVAENYVKDVPFTYRDSQDREHVTCNTQWTQKGRMWLYDKLKSSGILPMCERVPVLAQ